MPVCPYCGAPVPDGASACGRCGASLVSKQSATDRPFASQPNSSSSPSSSGPTPWSGRNYDSSTRLQRALRRNELLSYAVVGLSMVLLVLIVMLWFS